MKNYKRFRVVCEVLHLIIAAAAVAAFIYFVYSFIPTIPIYD